MWNFIQDQIPGMERLNELNRKYSKCLLSSLHFFSIIIFIVFPILNKVRKLFFI